MSTEAQLPRDVNHFIKAFDEMKSKGLMPIAYVFAESVTKSGQSCALIVADGCFQQLVNEPDMKIIFAEMRARFDTPDDFRAFVADVVTKAVADYLVADVLTRPGGKATITRMKDEFKNVN